MAHLYRRSRKGAASPFWWISFRDPATDKVVRSSTKFRIGQGDETRAARRLEAEKTLAEASPLTSHRVTRFQVWVETYLQQHYSNPTSLVRTQAAWRNLNAFLLEEKVFGPEQVRRQHCLSYITWRSERSTREKPLSRNTIILELKIFGSILQEAVRREWIQFNVAYRLGIERARTAEKAEMTDSHVAIVRAEISRLRGRATTPPERRKADFLHVSFEIALRQGIRLGETHFNLREQVDFAGGELTIAAKGKDDFNPLMNPDLVPFLQGLIAEGRTWTYERPWMPSLVWFKFFDRLRRKHPELRRVSFHSSRVRVVSRLERAGAPEAVVKRMVKHASTTVHRVYRKVKKDEMAPYWKALAADEPQKT